MPRLRIREKFWETTDACSFYFEHLDGGTLFFKPGQFLTLILQIEGKEVRRSYSLCTVPVKDKYPGITVKRVKEGLISNYLLDHLKEGDIIECDYPAGIFSPEFGNMLKSDYFLIAAGSGITPLYSILQTLLQKENQAHVALIYANRDENSIIYKDKLEVFDFQYSDRLKVVHVLSKPSDEWQGFKDRLQPELLKNLIEELRQHDKKNAHFFLCGPAEFMQMVGNTVLELGYSPEQIKKEDFATGVHEKKHSFIATAKANTKHVKILYRKNEYEIEVPEGQYILETALDQGIKLPHSCQSGVCTACIATCVAGKVDTEEADALSDSEKKRGYVLMCVGRPLTENVTLEIE